MSEATPSPFGSFTDQIVFEQFTEPRQGTVLALETKLNPHLLEVLRDSGVHGFYSHQALAIDAWARGRDVGIFTGTNSGKSLCYTVPILQSCLEEPVARYLATFPTKALAQDQCLKFNQLGNPLGITAATYDGDTPKSARGKIRNEVNIIITNPDMLHLGILPSHENWAKFFKYLKVVVIDEVHTYRGVFGSHVGNVLRRMIRISEWYQSNPQIISCSATVGNGPELIETLTGRKAEIISTDGSPRGRRTMVFLNPPKISDQIRLSPNIATSEALATLVDSGIQSLAFSRSRIGAELVLRYTRDRVEKATPKQIESYRGGYTPKERRKIESGIKNRTILGISATNALEVGIDIGTLDAVILNGYPGSIASFGQQVGRAGRGERDGLAVFIPQDNPLDQHFASHPERLLEAQNETVVLSPENPSILKQHLECAAHERALSITDLQMFGPSALPIAEAMDRRGEFVFRSSRFYLPSMKNPAANVHLRGASGKRVDIFLEADQLGFLEYERAFAQAHEGAVYLHRGEPYIVKTLDLEKLVARVEPFSGNYYTQPIVTSLLEPGPSSQERAGTRTSISISECTVTETVQGFRKKTFDRDTVIDTVDLDLPSITFDTQCLRFDLPGIDPDGDIPAQLGAIHGLEHVIPSLAPAFIGCDRNDLGSSWYSVFHETLAPAVFVFDRTPGGVGLTHTLYDRIDEVLMAAKQRLRECECTNGCPGCLLSYGCEANNELLDKLGTLNLIRLIGSNLKGIV